ncbi:hypothetical protein GC194_01955 [bacterium]|nr:hypothetical protein [bacterium]
MAQDLSPYYFIVDNAMRELGLEPSDTRGDMAGQWNLAYGEVTLNIDMWEVEEQDGKIVFQVQAPLMLVPSKKKEQGFYRELCEINYILYGVAFSVVEETVFLKSMRDAGEMRQKDILNMIEYCGYYAEHYQKALCEKYQTKKL